MNRVQWLMASSSSMEKLEQERVIYWQITQGFTQERREEDRFHLEFYPNRQIIRIEEIKVLFEAQVWSLGTAPRWVAKANVMLFANEAHRCEWLKQCGFSTEWIETHLLPQEAEIIPFPSIWPLPQTRTRILPRRLPWPMGKTNEVATQRNLGLVSPG